MVFTLAEVTPGLKASRLQKDLRRAYIKPKWWVINQSLYATKATDPVLSRKAMAEKDWILEVDEKSAKKSAIIPWLHEEKIGYEKLKDFVR